MREQRTDLSRSAMNAGRRYAMRCEEPRLVTRIYEREVILPDGTVLTERTIVVEEEVTY